MKETVTPIFLITYLGAAMSKVPGSSLDDTGIALLGGVAMIVSGAIDTRGLVAICVAGWLLLSRRMKTTSILGLVDWHLITLFCSLFILIAALEKYNIPRDVLSALERYGLKIEPFSLSIIAVILLKLTSNLPAVMLLTKFLDPGQTTYWYVLALSSTFAGNLITLGSIVNLIVIEEAMVFGIRMSFWEDAKVEIPVTIVSIAFLILWTYI